MRVTCHIVFRAGPFLHATCLNWAMRMVNQHVGVVEAFDTVTEGATSPFRSSLMPIMPGS